MPQADKQSRSAAAKKAPVAKMAPVAEEAREVVALASEAAKAGLEAMPRAAGPLTADPQAAVIKDANITDEAKEMGPVFGEFLKSVGLAVAETQAKLDETFRENVKALSEARVDVIAVFEQELDDNGKMKQGNPIVQKLPALAFIDPPSLRVENCYLSADMKVREFSSGNGFQIQGKSQSLNSGVKGSYGLFGGGISGHFSYGQSSSEASGGSNIATDEAVGSMHLETTIQPRDTIEIPKPFVTQKGPSLKLVVTKAEATQLPGPAPEGSPPGTQGPMRRVGTKATITAELLSFSNAPLADKTLEVSVDQPTVGRDIPSSKTAANGQITINLSREVAAAEQWKAVETTVRVWMGLVSQTVVIPM